MEYTVHQRFRGKAMTGNRLNLPYGTALDCENGIIRTMDGRPVCYNTSENAHQYFARNDDGKGLERGRLTAAIRDKLAQRDEQYQERWDKVWGDYLCQPYRRTDHKDFWLWNQAFYDADIGALRYIARLVGAEAEE